MNIDLSLLHTHNIEEIDISNTYDIPKEYYEDSDILELKNIKVDFEGMKVNTFECYDKYLTNLYGDYMTLPPVEKRITHEIKVYKVGE